MGMFGYFYSHLSLLFSFSLSLGQPTNLQLALGWLVGCFGFNSPLRQYFSLYRAVSQRERERRERIDESKNVQTTPTRTYCKRNRPLPYCNQNCRTPRHWKEFRISTPYKCSLVGLHGGWRAREMNYSYSSSCPPPQLQIRNRLNLPRNAYVKPTLMIHQRMSLVNRQRLQLLRAF